MCLLGVGSDGWRWSWADAWVTADGGYVEEEWRRRGGEEEEKEGGGGGGGEGEKIEKR